MAENFPVSSLAEAQEHLRRPFSARALRWKVQASWPKEGEKKGGLLVAYIDARLVIERLDTVLGPLWSDHYELIPGTKAMRCTIVINGTQRADVGESTHSVKATVSDALKRAAVHYGVGLSIYSLAQQKVDASSTGMQGAKALLKRTKRGNKHDVEITDELEARLRVYYQNWLESKANTYGDPLDHGGDDDAVGMDPEENGTPAEPVQNSLELEAAITRLRELWEEKGDKRRLSKAKLNAQIKSIGTVDEAVAYAKSIPLKEGS